MNAQVLERAYVDGAVRDRVLVEVTDGRFSRVEPDSTDRRPDAVRVGGLTVPGFANTHSHAFHRALRGRTQSGGGTFWTWREQMYAVAARLDPDSYFDLARAVFAEMVAAGFTAVGEFHYLHHQSDGRPYQDPNAMGHTLIAAAAEVGIRMTLLDTIYLSAGFGAAGFGAAPTGVQARFADADARAWAERVASIRPGAAHVGVAAHSVRAVPTDALDVVAQFAAAGTTTHVHLSEQVQENLDCLAVHGCTPTQLLADHGLLAADTTVVHATHLDGRDIALIGQSGGFVAFCPTTERDLGDGIGPSRPLHDAGARIVLGSDSHAVVDPFEEMRGLEMNERLASQRRGRWTAAELLSAGAGHASLGFADAGGIAVGQRADLVTLDLASMRTAGTGADEHTAVFAAMSADVVQVMVDGRIVFDGDHGRLGADLAASIERIWA